jgi:thiol-disulfide isomerase/thioredoxin
MRRPLQTRRTACVLAAVLTTVVLAGCSGSAAQSGAPDKGFISGDGTVTLVAAADRDDVVGFAGTTLEGDSFDVADHRGQVVVVNVWGSWCPPCIAEAPALEKVWEQTRSQGVQFVGVNTRDQTAAARAHERRFEISYPSIDDDGGRVLLAFRGTLPPVAIPSTLVLDRSGRVAARVLGKVGAGTLRGVVDDVLAEPNRSASR